ncbi:MAG: B12-binding domain-containing radical SAM protein [Lachnospiraceae bacterium]
MKFLLVAMNAKYIHSNPALYSMKAYAEEQLRRSGRTDMQRRADMQNAPQAGGSEAVQIDILEATINQQTGDVLKEIYCRRPDFIGISCYIWNISMVQEVIASLHKILPQVPIWLGGPEVSYCPEEVLRKCDGAFGIICGEGEQTFADLIFYYQNEKIEGKNMIKPEDIPGLVFRRKDGFVTTMPRQPLDMDVLPFPYRDCSDFKNRIVYYETARGCPFSCAYCLSSVDKRLRYRSMKRVEKELQFFLDANVPQVKFIDRTFNCNHNHSVAILKYIKEHDNGVTNFHFEVAGDILTEEEMELLSSLRPGLVQLEIGVQTTNEETLRLVNRRTDLEKLQANVRRLRSYQNVHLHLDLIAGLPGENLDSFRNSFNQVYSMGGDELQLGFLKLLKGSPMEKLTDAYAIVTTDEPPYEVLSTRDLSYEDILCLKEVEEMLELYHNSGQFLLSEKALFSEMRCTPFALYSELAAFYKAEKEPVMNSSRLRRYEMLLRFWEGKCGDGNRDWFCRQLTLDFYQRENAKSRPNFSPDQAPHKNWIYEFYKKEAKEHKYLPDYLEMDFKQLMRMTHMEVFPEEGRTVLFDYRHRSPLSYAARMVEIKLT